MCRIHDRKLGEESTAPGMLIGSGTEVCVHTKIFCKELGRVSVAHDDPLEIRFQKTNDIELQIFNSIPHTSL